MTLLNKATVDFLKQNIDHPVQAALVLGSGLNPLAEKFQLEFSIPYSDIPHFPRPSVHGHPGNLYVGEVDGLNLALFEGRLHCYEGISLDNVVTPVCAAKLLGAKTLLVTNAAGGIHASLHPGDIMLIRDHLNLMGSNPLFGSHGTEIPNRFPDMSRAYSETHRNMARKAFQNIGLRCFEGVLAAVQGPSYETPAEIRMLEVLGADAVCMSTVPEVIMARALSMDVLGFSLITNKAAGKEEQVLDHRDVIQRGKESVDLFFTLLKEIFQLIAEKRDH